MVGPFIFVDEFQDTDRVQANIIDLLARNSDGAVIDETLREAILSGRLRPGERRHGQRRDQVHLLGPHVERLAARDQQRQFRACAVQLRHELGRRLRERGLRVAVLRHPMPYGDLERQRVQRFATRKDLEAARCTAEEREEYEPHIRQGTIVYAGVDYERILREAEREGIRLVLEPHPDDFIEDGRAAIDLIRGIDKDWVSFLYCAPHTFHQGGDIEGIMKYAGPLLTQLHIADSFDHRASSGLRYIVNPPGSAARIHQHLDIGQGEVDWDVFFRTLAEVNFDGIATVCVFAWEERARESSTHNLEQIRELVGNVYPDRFDATADAPNVGGDTSIADRARYDNYYIEHWSLWFDLRILVLTLWHILKSHNAR